MESPCLLLLTDFEPVFHQDDSIVCDETLEGRADAQEPLILLLRAESHDVLDARPVIPAPVEDHDLAGSRKMRNETLHVHLRLLTLGWRRQSENLEYARAHSLRYGFDDATFSGRVPSLEYHHDPRSGVFDPTLQLHQLGVKPGDLFVVVFSAETFASILLPLASHASLPFTLLKTYRSQSS